MKKGADLKWHIIEPYPFAYKVLRMRAGFNIKPSVRIFIYIQFRRAPVYQAFSLFRITFPLLLSPMKALGGQLLEIGLVDELSFSFSPLYGRILRDTGKFTSSRATHCLQIEMTILCPGYAPRPDLSSFNYQSFGKIVVNDRNNENPPRLSVGYEIGIPKMSLKLVS